MTPIFDSLTHPTLNGTFLGKKSTFRALSAALKKNGFKGACAVGMDGIGGYSHWKFWDECKKYKTLFPVASLDPHVRDLEKELKSIRSIGYRAIKLHPRFSKFSPESSRLAKILSLCGSLDLTVFYCTYFDAPVKSYPSKDPFFALVRALKKAPRTRVLLVHGGGRELLRYAELVRFNKNLLLDLSFTILKYKGSSVDRDIRFLFERFDRRLCVGSDTPDFSPGDLKKRFETFSRGLGSVKKRNIASKNLLRFLKGNR